MCLSLSKLECCCASTDKDTKILHQCCYTVDDDGYKGGFFLF